MSLPDGRRVVAFDFDGVLHEYHGWNGGKLNGPLPGMQALIQQLIEAGAHVVVHTTRKAEDIGPWLAEHYGISREYVYNEKWSRIDVFVDDRAVQFTPALVGDGAATDAFARRLLDFQPHWSVGGKGARSACST